MRMKHIGMILLATACLLSAAALAEGDALILPASTRIVCEEAFAGDSSLGRVVIPDGTVEIGERAFADSSVTEIVLPDSLEAIADNAFAGCSEALTAIVSEGGPAEAYCIENNIRCVYNANPASDFIVLDLEDGSCGLGAYIGTGTDVRVPATINGKNVSLITSTCFKGKDITSVYIPGTVKQIANSAFYQCSSLSRIELSEGLEIIEHGAFSDCSALEEIAFPSTVRSMGFHMMLNCTSLMRVTLPAGITEIPDYFLSGCTSITSFEIPESVTKVSLGAFRNCSSLKDVKLPMGLLELGEGVFSGCKALESMVIPEAITVLPKGTFSGCSSLTDVTLPEGMTAIGESAFSSTVSLTEIDLPSTVTTLGEYAFEFSGFRELVIPEGITSLGESCFQHNQNLEDIVFPGSLRTIGYGAFSYCNKLTLVVLTDGLTTIGAYAFSGCESLVGLYVPASVTFINGSAFEHCPNQITIITERDCEGLSFAKRNDLFFILEPNAESDFTVKNTGTSECTITGYKGTATDVYIPETIGGRTVTAIAAYAFRGKTAITSISSPNYVTTIGKSAFQNCTSLTHLQLNSIAADSMPESAISGCSKLRLILSVVIE